MSTYDDVYDIYKSLVYGIDEYYLPQSDEALYGIINIAVKYYNKRLNIIDAKNQLTCDKESETFNIDLSSMQLDMLAHCMRLVTYENMRNELASMLAMTTKDSSLKDYKAQMDVRNGVINEENKIIYNLTLALTDCSDLESSDS